MCVGKTCNDIRGIDHNKGQAEVMMPAPDQNPAFQMAPVAQEGMVYKPPPRPGFFGIFSFANLIPLMVMGEWECPDPERRSDRSDKDIREFVELARFEPGKETDQWFATIDEFAQASSFKKGSLTSILHALTGAYSDYNIYYRNAPGLTPGQTSVLTANITPPLHRLTGQNGECRMTSLLLAATLARLGFETVFIIGDDHVIVAIVSDKPELEGLKGIAFQPIGAKGDKKRYIYPLESTIIRKQKFDPNVQLQKGREFVKEVMEHLLCYCAVFVDMSGNVLWRNTNRTFLLGVPQDENGKPIPPSQGIFTR